MTTAPGGYQRIKLDAYIDDKVDEKPRGPIGVVTIAGTIVDGKAGPRHRRRRQHRQGDRRGRARTAG